MENSKKELDSEAPTAGGSSKAGHSHQEKQPTDKGINKPFSSTVPSTASGCVRKEGSHGYLKKMSTQERRKIEPDIKRKCRLGMFVWHG